MCPTVPCGLAAFFPLLLGSLLGEQHHAHSLFRMTSVELKRRHTYVGLKHLNLNDPPNEINCTHIIRSGKFSVIREDVWL